MEKRFWDGQTVHVVQLVESRDRRNLEVSLTEGTARELALALRRMQQTSIGMGNGVHELVNALDYVLVGDPTSRREHTVMQRGKQMDPSSSNAPDGSWNASTPPHLRRLRINPLTERPKEG